jgi:hypothetical protein
MDPIIQYTILAVVKSEILSFCLIFIRAIYDSTLFLYHNIVISASTLINLKIKPFVKMVFLWVLFIGMTIKIVKDFGLSNKQDSLLIFL